MKGLFSKSLLFSALLNSAMALLPLSDCRADGSDAFFPTWKLLSNQEKQHFVSGYVQGWMDAQKVTNIAIEFIKENPNKAVESLESIRKLYDVSLLKPEGLVREIDRFYSRGENKNASLSMAVTASKAALESSIGAQR